MNKAIKNFIEMIEVNPGILEERKIVAKVDTDVVASDEFAWWLADISEITLDEMYSEDERVYLASDVGDIEILEDNLIDAVYEDWQEKYSKDELESKADEIEKLATTKVKELGWEKVIIFHIGV